MLGPHGVDAAFMGYTAGHPEGSGHAPERASLPYRHLADSEVVSAAREVYRQLQISPRWSSDNDRLIRAWAAVCSEMNLRGLTDTVTEVDGLTEGVGLVSE